MDDDSSSESLTQSNTNKSTIAKRYKKIKLLGEGQFALVYQAEDTQDDNKIVAVKKIKLGPRSEANDGINRTALREIKLLQELKHENIIGLLDVFGHKSNISLVFDYMEADLEVIIKDSSIILTDAHIKKYMIMTLRGLEYIHSNWILHRDMKPNNLLIDSNGVLKLADFGLARFFGSPNRWYRAPELLYGANSYGTGVDMWAVGCILAELLLRVPFLPGDTDLDQLARIFQTLGSPNEDKWTDIRKLSGYVKFNPCPAIPLNEIFTAASDDMLDLLRRLFEYNPTSRITAADALQLKYFFNLPAPASCSALPRVSIQLDSDIYELSSNDVSTKRKVDDNDYGGTRKKLVF